MFFFRALQNIFVVLCGKCHFFSYLDEPAWMERSGPGTVTNDSFTTFAFYKQARHSVCNNHVMPHRSVYFAYGCIKGMTIKFICDRENSCHSDNSHNTDWNHLIIISFALFLKREKISNNIFLDYWILWQGIENSFLCLAYSTGQM